jgi:hypothetical protein
MNPMFMENWYELVITVDELLLCFLLVEHIIFKMRSTLALLFSGRGSQSSQTEWKCTRGKLTPIICNRWACYIGINLKRALPL